MHNVVREFCKFSGTLYGELTEQLNIQNKKIGHLRVKILGFRDFYQSFEKPNTISESEFFQLPQDSKKYSSFVADLRVLKAGDEPSNALEAIGIAMNSDWNYLAPRRRHIICVITDASAHPLEKSRKGAPHYPSDLPKTFGAFAEKWESEMDEKARRLVIFAPEAYPWSEICPDQGGFSDTIHYPLGSNSDAELISLIKNHLVSLVVNSI
ncbi:MAG: VWA domain-containing protein [Akkermansiaceae bacterium]